MNGAPHIHPAMGRMSLNFAAKGAAGQTPGRVTKYGSKGLKWSREYER